MIVQILDETIHYFLSDFEHHVLWKTLRTFWKMELKLVWIFRGQILYGNSIRVP